MTDQSRAFWVVAPGQGEIRNEPVRTLGATEVLVRTLYSGVSRGTEALVFSGRVPPSEYQRMRAPFQSGDFPAPVKYGYAAVGCVEQGPEELVGQNVFVLHPHQTRFVVPAESAYPLPPGVPPSRAVLAANLETAINALWDARLTVGDRVAVIGGGTVGCLVAWLAGRFPACEVELVDVNPHRAAVAEALGVRFAPPDGASEGADVVVHASGSPAGIRAALQLAGFEATIVELSWYGTQLVPVPLGEAFHSRRLTLKSSQVGFVASSQRARWTSKRRMRLALSLLRDPVLDTLVSGESLFDELPQIMAKLATSSGDTLCHRVRYA